jgi:hypothetical protein
VVGTVHARKKKKRDLLLNRVVKVSKHVHSTLKRRGELEIVADQLVHIGDGRRISVVHRVDDDAGEAVTRLNGQERLEREPVAAVCAVGQPHALNNETPLSPNHHHQPTTALPPTPPTDHFRHTPHTNTFSENKKNAPF